MGRVGAEVKWASAAVAFAFIAAMLVASFLLTRPLEWLFARVPTELDNLVMLSVIVVVSAIAHALHLSEALGAFLAGLLFSGVRDRHELERRLHVLRELGTAAFFFAFGLQAPLRLSLTGLSLGLGLLVAGVLTKTIAAIGAGILENLRQRARRRLSLSLWARGSSLSSRR